MVSIRFQGRIYAAKIVAALALFALVGAAAQSSSSVRICPPEPSFNGTCDFPCTRCEGSTCIIENPITNPGNTLECPEGRPCKILCFSVAGSTSVCSGIIIKCPQNASCDLICTGGSCSMAYMSCPVGGKHSCSATCDNLSYIGSFKCDNSTACNCNSACPTRAQCKPGVDCIDDPCFAYRSSCHSLYSLYLGVSRTYNSTTGTCSCSCDNSTDVYEVLGSSYPVCWSNETYCRTRGCGPHGMCAYVPKCKCDTRLFRGVFCTETCSCNARHLYNDTSSHVAACDFDTNSCLCETGWTGTFCNISNPLTCPLLSPVASPTEFTPTELPPVDSAPSAAAPMTEAAPVAAPIGPGACPYECDICEDGWCIVFSISLLSSGFGKCPPGNFPCRIICDETNGFSAGCWNDNECSGDRPCEFICGGSACYTTIFHCGSSVSCRALCSGNPNSPYDMSSIRIFRGQDATYANSSSCPVVEIDTCRQQAPCIPGVSCTIDDPCSSTKCFFGETAILNELGTGCECRLPNGTVQVWFGQSIPILEDGSCGGTCLNGGICNNGNCTCRPGFTGTHCESALSGTNAFATVYSSKSGVYCPRQCAYCDRGICVIHMFVSSDSICPDGWPCLFICQDANCGGNAICQGTSGPCLMYCSGDRIPKTAVYFFTGGGIRRDSSVRLTPAGNCIRSTLICNTTATGLPCGAVCANPPEDDTNQIKSVQCANNATHFLAPFRTSSMSGADGVVQTGSSNCWLSETCVITERDPCFINDQLSFRVVCPITANAFEMEAKSVVNATGQLVCSCVCPEGYKEQKFIASDGMADRYCIPTVDCSPTCANGGLCVYESKNSSRVRCQCYSGYSGPTCESRCFFPVDANVTSCDNGKYVVDGDVRVNRTVDLLKETAGLIQLNISGSLILLNSTSLVILPSNYSTGAPSVFIRGDLVQANNAALENEIFVIYQDGVPVLVSSQFFVEGAATLDGKYSLALNSSQIAAALRQIGSGNGVTLTLLSGSSVTTKLKDGDLIDIEDSAPCDPQRVVARARISSKSISAVFSLEANPNANSSACIKDPLNASAASVQVAAIVVGVLVPLIAIGAGVSIFMYQRWRTGKLHREMHAKLAGANYPTPSQTPPSAPSAVKATNVPASSGAVRKTSTWQQATTEEVELRNVE
eukprot:TRINITY_DN9951_c0_g1_i1.p1 TRINITY_DN9951_c0_g1~~TRINITY_DN9951_c0_g1_i1.p1  ORF type:complete len:1160 (+),score=67.66 TRINITY_DN9951_c0_g1_i1:174-3653(+)